MFTKWIKHERPAWFDKSNFVIGAQGEKFNSQDVCEQLNCKQISNNTFEICCIPFYVYNVSLGDIVETNNDHLVSQIIQASGHYTFRVMFHDFEQTDIKTLLISDLSNAGCLFEWYGENLLAIDVPNSQIARRVSGCLLEKERSGLIFYETGKL